MNKEPIGLYIFRFIVGFGLFAFMAMLYWSSTLVEDNLKRLRTEISQLKSDVFTVRTEVDKIHDEISKASFPRSENKPGDPPKPNEEKGAFENLLTEDPFYAKTLPDMLGKDFIPHGIRKEATIGKPEHLHPFSNWSQIAAWNNMCTVSIAGQHFGIYETLSPDMATRMELREDDQGRPEYWIFLRKNVFWQPLRPDQFAKDVVLAPTFLEKHPVTAHDFKFYFDAIMNPRVQEAQAVALRTYYGDIQEIKVIDDYTLVVRWKTEKVKDENGEEKLRMKYSSKSLTASLKPLASFVFQYFPDGTKIVQDDADPETYRNNSVWAQNFSQHWAKNVIVSCGAWLFDSMTEREIRFQRNHNHYDRYAVLVEGLEIKFKNSPDAIWEEFKSGSLDLDQLPSNQIAEAERFMQSEPYFAQKKVGLGINRLDFIDRSYTYVGWNEANPLFKSKRVRQALTMAIDRKRIIDRYLNGMGVETTGTFFRYSPSYDPSIKPYPFDIHKAKAILEEEGWFDSDGDGIIDKMIDGKRVPFQFTLMYYVKNSTSKSIAEYIATTLKEVGILCKTNGVDIADLSASFDDKSFESILLAWALGSPPEDPNQLWHSSGAKEKGSSNAIGFANPEIDRLIEKLEYEYDPEKRIKLYHQFDTILYEESPYTFLYTPKAALFYRVYLQNVFIPADRQDLIPGANVAEPQSSIFWIKEVTVMPATSTPKGQD